MMDWYRALRPLLFLLPPEWAHTVAIRMISTGLCAHLLPAINDPRLSQELWGRHFSHPLGIGAGFDKDAKCLSQMAHLGFSFLEAGTVTRYPQLGNPKPRLFRLKPDAALINRMGFNNEGIELFLKRLREARRTHSATIPLGVNIGINKNTQTPVEDYSYLLKRVAPYADYVTVNVSSPNTIGLRELQRSQKLEGLLQTLMRTNIATNASKNEQSPKMPVPLFVKIAPDLTDQELEDVADLALRYKLSGVIISNTTIQHKDFLNSYHRVEQGGLSGRPLYIPSTIVLGKFFCLTKGQIPLIGVGGIEDGMSLYQKIQAGASLCQLYTALIYQGPWVVHRAITELLALMEADGVQHIRDVVGTQSVEWARHELPEAYL